MRRVIETAPRDGQVIILEDDASGKYDVAHWSPEAGEWVGENGEPIAIAPSHWYPMQGDHHPSLDHDGSSNPSQVGPSRTRRYAIPVVLVVAAFVGTYFHAEIAAFVTRHAGQPNIFGGSPTGEQAVVAQETQLHGQDSPKADLLPWLQQKAEADQPGLQAVVQAAAQDKQVVEASIPEAPQSSENEQRAKEQEQRAEALAQELADARRAIDELNLQLQTEAEKSVELLGQEREKAAGLAQEVTAARQELTASTAQQRQALEEARARGAALASDLAAARREIEMKGTLLRWASDEAAQLKQAAESATAELRQALQQERDKAEAMARDLEVVRRTMVRNASDQASQLQQTTESATAELRQALQQERDKAEAMGRDLEVAQRTIMRKTSDEAAQLKQAESAMAELRQALQRERDETEAMARDLESMRRAIDGRVMSERAANNQIVQVTQIAEVVATEQPAAIEAQGSPEATRLIARAGALLGQGNIGAARIVLERAAETGSAQASFMLAETYDPVILSAWGTYGTRGEATKARELYSKAHAGGIQEARDRFNALR